MNDADRELTDRADELDAIDVDLKKPGIQTGYDLEAAKRGNRFVQGLGFGVLLGVALDQLVRLLIR